MTIHAPIPDPDQRVEFNQRLHATGADTGFWDEHGRPAPWPDDIDQWMPYSSEPINVEPREQPF